MGKSAVIVFGVILLVLFGLMVCGVVGPLFGLVLMACAWGVFVSDTQTQAEPQQSSSSSSSSSSSPILDTLAFVGMLSLLDDNDDDHHSFDNDDNGFDDDDNGFDDDDNGFDDDDWDD